MLAHSRCNDCPVVATFDTGQSDGDSQPGRRTLVGVSVCLSSSSSSSSPKITHDSRVTFKVLPVQKTITR